MDRLLITDVKGFMGAGLAAALADRFEVLDGKSSTNETWQADLRDAAPQWIIHCGPLARSSWDTSPLTGEQAADLAALATAAREADCRLTVLSTDAVFTGPRLFHAEDSPLRADGTFVQTVRALETAGADIEHLSAEIRYDKTFDIQGDTQRRQGKLVFESTPGEAGQQRG